jgi:hypothetical protein
VNASLQDRRVETYEKFNALELGYWGQTLEVISGCAPGWFTFRTNKKRGARINSQTPLEFTSNVSDTSGITSFSAGKPIPPKKIINENC